MSDPMPVMTRIISADELVEPERERHSQGARRQPVEDDLLDGDGRRAPKSGQAETTDTRNAAEHGQAGDAAGDGLRQPAPEGGVDDESPRRAGAESGAACHHLSDVNASGLSVSRCRKSAMTSARPTAASAAATVMTKNVMIWPSTVPW